jgi:MFS family permease
LTEAVAIPKTALGVSAYRRYFSASLFSTFGLWMLRFLVGWEAWSLTESAFWVGVISSAMLVPTFILSPLFGVVADRIKLRLGLFSTTAFMAVIGFVLSAFWGLGWLTIHNLALIALAKGVVMAAHHPLRFAMMPHLIPKSLLPSGIGISSIVFNTSRVIAPAVAAGILTLSSTGFVLFLSGVLFSIGALRLLSVPEAQAQGSQQRTVWLNLKEGFWYAAQTPGIRLLLYLAVLNGLLGRAVIEILPAVSGQLLSGNVQTLALLTALAGLGSIAAGLIIMRQDGRKPAFVNLVIAAIASTGLLMYLLLLPTSLILVAAVVIFLALAMTLAGAGCQTLVQIWVQDDMRGRVMSFWAVISMGFPAIGAFVMGGLADLIGFPFTLGAAGTLVLISVILIARDRHRIGAA